MGERRATEGDAVTDLLHVDLMPSGIRWVRDPLDVCDDIETVRVYDSQTRLLLAEQFTWTPFAKTAYRRVGLFRWEPYRTYDYPALDEHRRRIGVALVQQLLAERRKPAGAPYPTHKKRGGD